MARCFAVAMSQAPGLSGTPDSGHCSSTATSASWARSSAIPTSPTMRARPAMSLADSIHQTASMASAAVRRVIHHLAHFHFQILRPESDVRFQEFAGPLDRVLLRGHIVDRVAADDFLRLGEGSVRHRDLPVGQPSARALRRRRETAHPYHDAFLGRFLTQLPDLLDERRRRLSTRLARLHNRHEFHGHFPEGCNPSPASMTPALTNSSLNFPISASSCSLGMAPASYSLCPFTITRYRIAVSLPLRDFLDDFA